MASLVLNVSCIFRNCPMVMNEFGSASLRGEQYHCKSLRQGVLLNGPLQCFKTNIFVIFFFETDSALSLCLSKSAETESWLRSIIVHSIDRFHSNSIFNLSWHNVLDNSVFDSRFALAGISHANNADIYLTVAKLHMLTRRVAQFRGEPTLLSPNCIPLPSSHAFYPTISSTTFLTTSASTGRPPSFPMTLPITAPALASPEKPATTSSATRLISSSFTDSIWLR